MIRPDQVKGLRDAARSLVEWGLADSSLVRWRLSRMGGRTVVLAYHNVVPDGSRSVGDRSLHLTRSEFAAQLDVLEETHDVVSLDAAVDSVRGNRTISGEGDRPRAAVTFDDAYVGALTLGVDELAKRGLPATVFVSPGNLGDEVFWWDAFAGEGEGLSSRFRRWALVDEAGRAGRIRREARPAGSWPPDLPPEFRPGSEATLREACRRADISLGTHTWDHPNLTRIPSSEVEGQIRRSLDWLDRRFDVSGPWISYPYGLSSPAVRHMAGELGCRAGFGISGGWLPRHTADPLALPRLNVPAGISLDGFRLRMANLFCR